MSLLQIMFMIMSPPFAGFLIYNMGGETFRKKRYGIPPSLALAGIMGIGFLKWTVKW